LRIEAVRIMPLNEQDFVAWQQATLAAMPSADEAEPLKGASKSPVPIRLSTQVTPEFHKTSVRSPLDRKESLLTRALQPTDNDSTLNLQHAIEMARHRSTRSNTSAASTAELTSDGGLTSPARSNTPSPPIPNTTYLSFAPYTLGPKLTQLAKPRIVNQLASVGPKDTGISQPDPKVEALVKKRCISFACGAQKPKSPEPAVPAVPAPKAQPTETPKRTIKFACTTPKPSENDSPSKVEASPAVKPISSQKSLDLRRQASRSPSLTRKIRPTPTSSPSAIKGHRDSISTIRRASQSPAAVRRRKPKYIVADEEDLESSEATRFHEFASDGPQEDDWIRKDLSHMKEKLTINDTLKKENAIRQLGKEAEEEALQDEEEEDDDDEETADDTDDDNDDESDYQDNDHTINGSEDEASDGNETDNEAGFADSDDESDPAGEYQFWTPGRGLFATGSGEAGGFLTSANRAASVSSIDSLSHMSPILKANGVASGRSKPSRKIKIRPGTPDLPDSTDFVCGTLDEDRPLEEAYVSCMEARKREKHHLIPQDIDPSFPTSDPDEEEDENDDIETEDSNEDIWLHGKFEDSEDEDRSLRRTGRRRSQEQSPRRLHSPPPMHYSPPPTRVRHRSPPPRRLFNHSPKRMRSPPPARTVKSPRTSPVDNLSGITFKPLGDRPGLTHTKSLPRRTSAFCQQYRAARLISANAEDDTDTPDGHTRGAIDIVKGLEHKRQRRKEKFYRQQCNRARKGQNERTPQPGKGAERMRELGLQMAGKADLRNNNKAEYILSV
jgi:hypothetical protein